MGRGQVSKKATNDHKVNGKHVRPKSKEEAGWACQAQMGCTWYAEGKERKAALTGKESARERAVTNGQSWIKATLRKLAPTIIATSD